MLNEKHSKRYTWEGNFLKLIFWYWKYDEIPPSNLLNKRQRRQSQIIWLVSISRQLWLKFKSARIHQEDDNSSNQKVDIFILRMLWRLRIFFTNGNLILNNKDMNLKYRLTVADLKGHLNLFIRESYLKKIMLSKYSWNSMHGIIGVHRPPNKILAPP